MFRKDYRQQIYRRLFSEIEIRDLIKAWFAISLAFAIVMSGITSNFIISFLISGLTVGLGFLFHELGHKFLAQKYGCLAEFRANNLMLILAVAMSFFGFILAAPGGVFISGHIKKEQYGKISAIGPAINLILAALFMLLIPFTTGILQSIGTYGSRINSWLALFNLIPFAMFDGRKILDWNKVIYGILVIIAVVFTFVKIF